MTQSHLSVSYTNLDVTKRQGQSMYEVQKYVDTNINGTAILLDYLVNEKHNIKKVVICLLYTSRCV